ncbi:hypothetical protein GCM10023184_14600 [Flaviaesturariibacter amylovorans]|uniref:Surface-adhesin protein E-like domain-containing protein n=1 Tax=Flaviaesturariibacter amylovorans TaxID=1084520 RepID=A0ABP8GKM6_9BACT
MLGFLIGSAQSKWAELITGTEYKMYYNTSRTTREGSIITAWLKTVESGKSLAKRRLSMRKQFPDFAALAPKFSYEIIKREYDCDAKRYRLRGITGYTTDGKVIYTFVWDEFEAEWEEIVPDSNAELTLDALCEEIQ